MTNQIPLILSDDAKQIIRRVETIYGGRMPLSELQTCWRPPAPREGKRPWPDKRLWSAIEEAENGGAVMREAGICGDVLVFVRGES